MKSVFHYLLKWPVALAALMFFTASCDLRSVLDAMAQRCTSAEFAVTRTDDPSGGFCTGSDCSLRQAVSLSNSCAGTQTIQIPDGSYTLSRGELAVTQDVAMVGEGGRPTLTGTWGPAIHIARGASASIENLQFSNFSQIENEGNLTASGLYMIGTTSCLLNAEGATADISHSAFVQNGDSQAQRTYTAACIENRGTLSISNVTISNNFSIGLSAESGSTTHVSYTTIADNTGWFEVQSGAAAGAFSIDNSIVAGNHESGHNCSEALSSTGFNLDNSTAAGDCGFTQSSDLMSVDPRLQPLGERDSAGMLTLTRPLAPGSPAINSADAARCPGTDQRGVTRPQGAGCDRGAYETTNVSQVIGPTLDITPPPPAIPMLTLRVNGNANCRIGPGVAYDVVYTFKADTTLTPTGRNQDGTWWEVTAPNGKTCMMSHTTVELSAPGDALPVLTPPPLPEAPSTLNDSPNCGKASYTVKLNWTEVAGVTGYRIYRNGELIATLKPNVTRYSDNAPMGEDLEYQLASTNQYGESERLVDDVNSCGSK